jgi:sulfonate dioxygenase
MSSTATTTTTNGSSGTLKLRADEQKETEYRYAHLLPTFPKDEHYPPLTPFEHVDPGHRALQHSNPQLFLRGAKVTQLTPPAGEEIRGVNLATLTDDEKDELALEVH